MADHGDMVLDTAAASTDRAAARCFDPTRNDLFFASNGRSAILAPYTRMIKVAEVAAPAGAEPAITPEVALAASLGVGVETAPALVITRKLGVKKAPLRVRKSAGARRFEGVAWRWQDASL